MNPHKQELLKSPGLQAKHHFRADRDLVNDLRHVFPELALFLVHFGQHQHLVAGAHGQADEAGGVGLFEAAVAAGQHHAAVVGHLGVAPCPVDLVLQAQAGVEGDGVGKEHFAADEDEAVFAGDAQHVAVFQQQLVALGGLGQHHLAQGFDLFGAVHPLQGEFGFFFAQACAKHKVSVICCGSKPSRWLGSAACMPEACSSDSTANKPELV